MQSLQAGGSVSVDIWVRREQEGQFVYKKITVVGEVEARVEVTTIRLNNLSDLTDIEMRRAAGQLEAEVIKKIAAPTTAETSPEN